MANYDKQFNVNKGLSVKGVEVIDENRNVKAATLTVTGTGVVTNLNAEKVAGYSGTDIAVRTENETISGDWNYTGTPTFGAGVAGAVPFALTGTNPGLVTGLNADKVGGYRASEFAITTEAKTISGAWTFGTAPIFSAVGAPFSVSATGKVTNLNADLVDGYHADTSATVSTIALRDTGADLTARNFLSTQLSMSHAAAARNSDTVFYSSTGDLIYKNSLTGFKTSLALNSVENTALSTWAGSANITTLGSASSAGTITASRFTSNVANGTAPFTVTSGTVVPGLNADKVDGYDASSFVTIAGTSFYLGTTNIPLSSTSGQITSISGLNITGSASNVTGVVAFANGGTGLNAIGAANYILTSTGTAMTWIAKPTAFPGFGIDHVTAAYGDHTHSNYLTSIANLNTGGWLGCTLLNANSGISNGFRISGTGANFTTDGSGSVTNTIITTTGNCQIRDVSGTAGLYMPLFASNITAGGTFTVTGTTTAAAIGATNITASGTLGVTGTTTATAINATNINASGTLGVTGTTTCGNLNSSGTITQGGVSFLKLNGGTLTGAVTSSSTITASDLYSNGALYLKSYVGLVNSVYGYGTSGRVVPWDNYTAYFANSHQFSGTAETTNCTVQIGPTNGSSLLKTYGNVELSKGGGNVTIGTSGGTAGNLYVYGSVNYASIGSSSLVASDIRLKRDIRKIDSETALNQITQISKEDGVIGYRMKVAPIDSPEVIGVSAQVINKIIPEATGLWDVNNDGIEYLTWSPNSIVALLIAAVGRLNDRLTSLEQNVGVA